MAYKVLNNVQLKDATGVSSLSTDMLVLVINKNTKNDHINLSRFQTANVRPSRLRIEQSVLS